MQDVRANRYSDFISWAPRNIGAFYFPQKHLKVHDWNSEWLITERGDATHSVPCRAGRDREQPAPGRAGPG